MKKLVLFLILSVFSSSVMAFEDVILPQDGYNASMSARIKEVVSDEEFNELEKKVFKKIYSNDTAQKRLGRLEKEVLGMEQGGDIQDRLDNLYTAMQYYQEGYRVGENSTPKNNAQYSEITQPTLNSWNYIQEYDLPKDYEPLKDYDNQNNYSFKTAQKQKYITEDYLNRENINKKESKIKRFFNSLVDILSLGVVTGYTPSVGVGGFGTPDMFDSYSVFGGSNIIGLPQRPGYVRMPRYMSSPNYYSSYPKRYISPPPIPPSSRYNPHHPYTRGSGVRTYGSGARASIIY